MIPDKNQITTGNSKLDLEHTQIFDTLDRLQDENMSQAMRIAACERLLHYISEHCRDEEDLMRFHQYPKLEQHKEAHRNLQEAFLRDLSKFIKTGGESAYKIRVVLYEHVLHVDLPMIKYVQTQIQINSLPN
jgi:hemerythrin-like metal-binding protein